MSWEDERQLASFRGLTFEAENLGASGGKRLVVDEYPQTDDHSVEDLGQSAKRFRLRGFVDGPDYLDRLGNLEAAFLQRGAGELVHPWRGRLHVHVETYEITHDLSGGVGEFEISCVIAGLETRPVILVVTETDIIDKGEATIAASRVAFEDRRVAYFRVATSYLSTAVGAFMVAERADFEEVMGVVVAATGSDLAMFDEMVRGVGGIGDVSRLLRYLGRARGTNLPRSTGTAREEAANGRCLGGVEYLRAACLARVCQLTATTDYVSAAAAEDMQGVVAALIQAEQEADPTDEVFSALEDLRASFLTAISSAIERLPRVRKLKVIRPTPSLVLACRLYGSIDREEEIIRLNAIASPFFCAGDLQVLT